jgi:hypothetical protein
MIPLQDAVHQRNPADLDEQFSDESLSEAVIPHLANLCRSDLFYGQGAMCLMHSASPHVSPPSLSLLGDSHVLVVAFRAHTTSIFQVLDLVLVGAREKLNASGQGVFGDNSANDHITRLVRVSQ